MSQACYAENCTNSVTGQCLQGYKGSCGRFYCRQHQHDGLCGICNDKKLHDEEEKLRNIELKKTINKYTELAEGVDKISLPIFNFFLMISILFSALGFWGGIFIIFQDVDVGIILVVIFILSFSSYVIIARRKDKRKGEIRQQRINEITKDSLYFDEFYKIWKEHKNKKNKDELRSMALNTLGFSAKLAGGVVTQAHKENKKLGIDILR